MNNLDKQYISILKDILDNGYEDKNRTDVDTLYVLGRTIRHKMSEGFPLLTCKRVPYRVVREELEWFLSGSTDIRDLWNRDVHIWDGDWDKNYKNTCNEPYTLKEMKKFAADGDTGFHESTWSLGPIYGHQWRHWGEENIDQFANAIELLKSNPTSRRIIVNAWNPSDLNDMTLPPCFLPGSLVNLRDGEYKKIEDVGEGDEVLTESSSFDRVYETHKTRYTGDIVNFKISGFTDEIRVTPNHPLLVKNKGYIRSEDITKDDYIGIPINQNNVIPKIEVDIKQNQYSTKRHILNLKDKHLWYLMGYFLGDGWLIDLKKSNIKRIYFSISHLEKQTILPKLRKVIDIREVKNSGEGCSKYEGMQQGLFRILKNFNDGAFGKRIPEFVHNAPKSLVKVFLEGYQDADGCNTNHGKSITTVSPHIAYGIQRLYAKIGIKAAVYKQDRPTTCIINGIERNQQNTYNINISKNKNKSNSFIFENNILWFKIKNISTTVYDGYVYNISVENSHTYTVNNIINHNCHYGFELHTRLLSVKERLEACTDAMAEQVKRDIKEYVFPEDTYSDKLWHEVLDRYYAPKRALTLIWNQRSGDFPLGIPFNLASYGTLLCMIADEVRMVPDELIARISNCHIYKNQIKGVKELIEREPRELPTIHVRDGIYSRGDGDIHIDNYNPHSTITFPLTN